MAWVMWCEILLRWILGLQMLFWGLNGFFHWKPVPPSSDFVNRFVEICRESRFLLPTVKIIEIIFGAILLTSSGTLLALIFLGPIVFVVSGLHLFHNPKSYEVLVPITVPFLLLLLLNGDSVKTLLLN